MSDIFSAAFPFAGDLRPVPTAMERDIMDTMKKTEFSVGWLTGLGDIVRDPQLYELLKYCPLDIMQRWRFEEIQRGAFICRQGEICQRFSLIIAGEVDVFYEAEDGRRYRQARYRKGDMLGELEIFESRHYICSVVAVGHVQLLSLSQEYFSRWLALDNILTSGCCASLVSNITSCRKRPAATIFTRCISECARRYGCVINKMARMKFCWIS